MIKFFKKKQFISFLMFLIISFFVVGCSSPNDALIKSFTNETNRKYVIVYSNSLWINGKEFNFEDSAKKLVKKGRLSSNSVDDINALDDKVVFTYSYNTKRDQSDEYQYNTYYNVGLFTMSYATGKCELIKKFEKINGFYKAGYYPWNILSEVFNDKYAIIEYNGMLEVIDIDSKIILFSENANNKSQELENFLEQNKKEKTEIDYESLSFGAKDYHVDFQEDSYILTEKESETEYILDHNFFMNNSQTYKSIYDNWSKSSDAPPQWIGVCNDRLIVGCQAKPQMFFNGGKIPLLLFEVNLETYSVLYIGHLKGYFTIYEIVEL